jgi:hypothetical protein
VLCVMYSTQCGDRTHTGLFEFQRYLKLDQDITRSRLDF